MNSRCHFGKRQEKIGFFHTNALADGKNIQTRASDRIFESRREYNFAGHSVRTQGRGHGDGQLDGRDLMT